MQLTDYFRTQAFHNAWCNFRLIRACAQLGDADLIAPRTSFFPSLIHTLNHILTVDWFYVSALEGASIGNAAFEPEIPYLDIADIAREQEAEDRRLIAISTADPTRSIDLKRSDWVQTERADRVLLHLFQHQIHHRGQVHAMLAGTEINPPQLDEFFLAHEGDAALRADDFATLGFTEPDIWRG